MRGAAAAALLGWVLSAGACDQPCERWAHLTYDCSEAIRESGSSLHWAQSMCQARRGASDEVRRVSDCALQAGGDCDAYRRCELERRDAVETDQVRAAIAEGRPSTGIALCRSRGAVLDEMPGLAEACGTLRSEALESLDKQVTGLRDRSDPSRARSACRDYRALAKDVSAKAAKRAEVRCKEADLAPTVRAALAEAKLAATRRATTIPPRCKATLSTLSTLGSPWSKARAAELAVACYQELGASVLSVLIGKGDNACTPAMREIIAQTRRYELTSGKLQGLLTKAQTLCR